MIAAVELEWFLIGAAALALALLLAVVLLGHRVHDGRLMASPSGAALSAEPPLAARGSFLDEPLARDFESLGKPAGETRAPAPVVLEQPEPVDPFAPHDDLFPVPPAPAPATAAQLSDVMVTSDHDEIDLGDPDVRAMLAGLMRDEIELARIQQAEGQTLEAILELTEAEKIAVSLDLDDCVAEVRGLLAELQR